MNSTFSAKQQQAITHAEALLGYAFTDKHLLLSAITHPSAAEGLPVAYSYERLEFLGDSIVGAFVALEAYRRFPDIDEGALTRIKSAMVCGAMFSRITEEMGFARIILMGPSEERTGRRGMHTALENVYEALVAALFLDGGTTAARAFVEKTLLPLMDSSMGDVPQNPKSQLQEQVQKLGFTLSYDLLTAEGPAHNPHFVYRVSAGGVALGRGEGKTKREAQAAAAAATLENFETYRALLVHY